ncbi:MAG: hypothetical protein EBW39_06300 [Betaproteobacteria bacterium]|nr:hypothetical protein [Betaproteobacteria bacterium]
MPCCWKKSFSSSLSWAIATALAEGRTGLLCAKRNKLGAGTFSNSVVIASQIRASSSSASLSS